MADLGPTIGQLGANQRNKSHPKYRKSATQSVLATRLSMPGGSGFLYLQGSAVYNSIEKLLVVTVSSKRRPDNYGPGIFLKRTFDWDRLRNEDGSVPETLNTVLQEIATQVGKRQFPERDLFIEKCNNSGQVLEDFLEDVCATCHCWYCDLAS